MVFSDAGALKANPLNATSCVTEIVETNFVEYTS